MKEIEEKGGNERGKKDFKRIKRLRGGRMEERYNGIKEFQRAGERREETKEKAIMKEE